ncbi:MAG: hypothetical protein HY430_00720 [Candidatus Levybacteria bacterium]|nr:hypothetical protein [Candidatus Levybacteria bacterium]
MNTQANALEGQGLPPADRLSQAIQEYKTSPHTPELIDRTFQTVWSVWGESIGHSFDVPACDRSSEELESLRTEGRGVLLVPDEVYTREGLILLGRVFPKMNSWSVGEDTTVVNEHTGGGCIDVEMTVDAPYRTDRGYTEQQLRDAIAADGREGQRVATYIVGSQISKLLTGRLFDKGSTSSRLPGSSDGGRTMGAYFAPNGYLHVSSNLDPQYQSPRLGGRSEGRHKANKTWVFDARSTGTS